MSADTPRTTSLAARFVSGLKQLTARAADPAPPNDVELALALKLAALRARAMREGIAALRERREGLRLGVDKSRHPTEGSASADAGELIVLATETPAAG